MASNFAGVQGADDSRNDIVVRGNSPIGVLWRLEGVDIPNPNHFAIAGTTGGPVSIINNKYLSNSDFFTGAFPAEYGNSIAGVFDLNMRRGNNEQHEFSGQLGFLGTELFAEGPINKSKKSSYLGSFRYSTLQLFQFMNLSIGTSAVPNYFDGGVKLSFPKGTSIINVFAIGGKSNIDILDKDGMNDKFTWEDIESAQKSFDAKKFPEMQKYADFLNSEEVSREKKYVIGSGPYILDKWTTGQSIALSRSNNYWNKSEIPNYPDKLIFKTIKDQNAAVVAAKNKETDYMEVIQPIDFVENVKNPEQFNLRKALVTEPAYNYISWNNMHPIFSDKKVRWAMAYAIDRRSIIDKIVYGMGTPIQSHIFIKSRFHNSDLPEIPYDMNKAKQMLLEAGWKDTDGDGIIDKVIEGKKTDFRFTFTNNTNPKRKKVILILIEQLKQLGIEANIQEYEWSVFLEKIKKHQFDACFAGWQLTVTPDDPYQIWHSSQATGEGSNHFSYINPESDKLLEENRMEFDDNKRMEILKKWQKIIYDDQPVTFLWSEPSRYLYSDRYRNTRWYSYPDSPLMNEWWVQSSKQMYKN